MIATRREVSADAQGSRTLRCDPTVPSVGNSLRAFSNPKTRNTTKGVPYRAHKKVLLTSITVTIALMLSAGSSPSSQDKPVEKDLKAKVAELVKGLDAPKSSDRQAAQAELVTLGADVLPLLPAPEAEDLSAEQRRRLREVRSALGKLAGKASLLSSKVTLSAKSVTLSDAISAIQRQTGNEIVDLREEFGQEVTNPEFVAEWKDKPFWEALDEVSSKTNVSFYLHTGERQIGLIMQPIAAMPTAYAGPLRITLNKIVRWINYENKEKQCELQFEIAWEPRVRPILFEMKPEDIEIMDDLDRKITVESDERRSNAQEEGTSLKAAVDSSMIRTDFIIRLGQPPKGAEKIKSLKGKLTVVMPTNIQTFEFADLAKAKAAKKQAGNVTVTLEQFKELDSGLWSAEVLLEFEAKSEAFESYETWFYDNEAYLQKADGTRFVNNGGQTLTESDGGRVGIHYRFVDAPGKMSDYKLIYKTPSTIVRDSVTFELKDLELP